MGQYYMAVILDHPSGKVYAVTTFSGDGAKLTEHSFDGSRIIQVVENLLRPGGAWHGLKLVWAGDYADVEKDSEHNLYDMPDKLYLNKDVEPLKTPLRYAVNHTKKLYVDKTCVPESARGCTFHPLPLLHAKEMAAEVVITGVKMAND